MQRNLQGQSTNGVLIFVLVLISILILERGMVGSSKWYWFLLLTVPGMVVVWVRGRRE
jgi:hypothetical protein